MSIGVNIEQMPSRVRVFAFPFSKAGLNTLEIRGPVPVENCSTDEPEFIVILSGLILPDFCARGPNLSIGSRKAFFMLKKISRYLWPYRFTFLFALAQVFIMSGCELLKPWPLKIIIDNVLSGNPAPWGMENHFTPSALLLLAVIGLVVIYVILGGITLLNNYTTIKIGQQMVNDMRRDLYAHLQRLSLAFHSRRQVGDLMYRVTADTYSIQSLTMNGVFPIVTAVVLLGGMFSVMIKIDWELTVLSLAVCPALLVSISVMSRRISEAAMLARREESEVYTVVQRAMSAIRIIQAFTKEEEEHRKFMSASNRSLGASLKLYTLQTFYSGIVNVVMAVGTALVVWVGARHVMSGQHHGGRDHNLHILSGLALRPDQHHLSDLGADSGRKSRRGSRFRDTRGRKRPEGWRQGVSKIGHHRRSGLRKSLF